jgi:hypothetical protein
MKSGHKSLFQRADKPVLKHILEPPKSYAGCPVKMGASSYASKDPRGLLHHLLE